MKKFHLLLIIFSIILVACSSKNAEEEKNMENNQKVTLTISAAASMSNCLFDIEKEFHKQHPSIPLIFNFGASGSLQQQIINGAPVDLFIFADKVKAEILLKKNLVLKETEKDLLSNSLVLIVPKTSKKQILSPENLLNSKINKIAIGTPETVPAGKYTKQALINLGLWTQLEKSEKFIPTKDVRQVLTYVETNNVDAGFVYQTDARQSKKVKMIAEIPDNTHDMIVYSTGIINSTKYKKEATIFYNFLLSKKAKTIFTNYGFKVLK